MTDLPSDRLPTLAPFAHGDIRLDPASRCIERAGSVQRVEAKDMQVLLALAREPRRVFSRPELEESVWSGRIVTDDALTNAIGKLRRGKSTSRWLHTRSPCHAIGRQSVWRQRLGRSLVIAGSSVDNAALARWPDEFGAAGGQRATTISI